MVKQSNDDGEALPVVMRLLPEGVVRAHDPGVVERCWEIWSGPAAMNAEATERWYAREVDEDTPVPTAKTIREWANKHDWRTRLLADLERNHGELLYDMQLRELLNHKTAGEEMSKVLAGVYDADPMAGALRIKARELTGREYERRIKASVPSKPAKRKDDDTERTLEEEEAIIHNRYQERKRGA